MTGSLLTRAQLARELHISIPGLEKLIFHPRNPIPYIRAGRRFLFRLDDVLRHLEKQTMKGVRRG